MRGAVGCICPDAFPEVKTVPGVLQIRQEVLSVKKFVAALLTLAVMVCTASFCFAEAQLPSVKMEQQKKEYRTPQGQVCIVTDYTRLIVENADAFPALAQKLEQVHNKEWNYRMEDEAKKITTTR